MHAPSFVTSSIILAVVAVGCAHAQDLGGGSGGSGANGATSGTTTNASSTGTGGGGSGSSGTGGSTGGAGCRAGSMPCAADEWCDFSNNLCGASDWLGVCRKRPSQCPTPPPVPVCGCDGKSYASDCFAEMAGVGVNANGSCTQAGTFPCGPMLMCQVGLEYCQIANGIVLGHQCLPLPASCLAPNTADCSCMPIAMDCGSCTGTIGEITEQHGCG
jgi:hypothetical protein